MADFTFTKRIYQYHVIENKFAYFYLFVFTYAKELFFIFYYPKNILLTWNGGELYFTILSKKNNKILCASRNLLCIIYILNLVVNHLLHGLITTVYHFARTTMICSESTREDKIETVSY